MTDAPTSPSTVDTAGPAQAEVVDLLSQLIAINTSNPTHPERPAAEWVAERLAEVDVESRIIEAAPGRASVVARIEGEDSSRPPMLINGHLDVVPAEASEWSVDPFAGEVRDGYVWGRGAVDMKDMDAMTLALVRSWKRAGRKPPRDIVLAFVSDEEAGGREGAHFLVDNHPDLFADCTEAISEVGGFSVALADPSVSPDLRIYAIQTAHHFLDEELGKFYFGLLKSEARHFQGYLKLAYQYGDAKDIAQVIERVRAAEQELIESPDIEFRFHSGVPA